MVGSSKTSSVQARPDQQLAIEDKETMAPSLGGKGDTTSENTEIEKHSLEDEGNIKNYADDKYDAAPHQNGKQMEGNKEYIAPTSPVKTKEFINSEDPVLRLVAHPMVGDESLIALTATFIVQLTNLMDTDAHVGWH